jgi:DNA topoisomerase I
MRGISRRRRGKGFQYTGPDGKTIREPGELERIASLAVPPAWTEVWICPYPNGHLQATGRDARGRKQYRYHPYWRTLRDATKFDRVLAFGRTLPRIRRRVAQDLRRPGLPRERVLATLVKLLERTLLRVGNEEYVRANGSYGLTTLRNRHARVHGRRVVFEFRGKRGIRREVSVDDPALARIVQRCAEIPGQELFQWLDADGARHPIDSSAVNDYLREASGGAFTAKDFRTWFGTLEALQCLRRCRPVSVRAIQRDVKAALAAVAERLGNTPAVCRRSYVHPQVLDAYGAGRLAGLNGQSAAAALRKVLRQPTTGPGPRRAGTRPARPRTVPRGSLPCGTTTAPALPERPVPAQV